MEKKILVIGNIGNPSKPDGQTVRTTTVLESIKKHYNDCYDVVFLGVGGYKILKLFCNINSIIRASKIVILPGRRALKTIAWLLNALHVSDRVVHVAIGGWLPDEIEQTAVLLEREKQFHAILVQMDSLRETLQTMGLENVVWFPNYRNSSNVNVGIKKPDETPNKYVFYSRVIQEKGAFTAIEAIKRLTDDGNDVQLDLFGPIDDAVKEELKRETAGYDNINYRRVLFGEEILETLSHYDCMLFPTCYRGEGFPGAVLESMMAGVPVIATDWKFNSEIVKDGETGIICGSQSAENVYQAIQRVRGDLALYRRICEGAYHEAKKYTEGTVAPILYAAIDSE